MRWWTRGYACPICIKGRQPQGQSMPLGAVTRIQLRPKALQIVNSITSSET